jgi:DNA-binding protein WhiA
LLTELAAVIKISGMMLKASNGDVSIRIVTENAAFARKVFSSFKKLYKVFPQVSIRRNRKLKAHISYTVTIPALTININLNDSEKVCCKKAFLRGAFLSGGSISDPEKTYHLEITSHTQELANEVCEVFSSFDLNAKVISRKGSFVTYIKEGEDIVDFLNIIGAHNALMELENIRILKEMRNNVNRAVNCETANLEKTVNASLRQVENIKYIKEKVGIGSLPENLQDIAELRLEFSDANLKELGEMLSPPLGKSGVNHRLRKLDRIAEVVRSMKGDILNG